MVTGSVIEEHSDVMVGLFSVGNENDDEFEGHQPDDFRADSAEAEPGSIGGS